MEKEYFDSLKKLDTTEVRFKLSTAVHEKMEKLHGGNISFLETYFDCIGIAYAIDVIHRDVSINPRTLETFKDTANLPDEMNEIVTRHTADYWNIVLGYQNAFRPEQLKAFILFENPDENYKNSPTPTPNGVSVLSHSILDIHDTDKVLDMCSGTGSFIIEAYKQHPNADFYGIDLNYIANDMLKIRADVLGMKINVQLADALEYRFENKMDKIFSNYPWGVRFKNANEYKENIQRHFNMNPLSVRRASSDWLFNTTIIDQLKESGKAVAIMAAGSTNNTKDSDIRKFFIENGVIEAVILLPDSLFPGTKIGTVLIVFSHHNTSVKLIDARHCYESSKKGNILNRDNIEEIISLLKEKNDKSIIVSPEELAKDNFILDATRYLETPPELENATPIKDVCISLARGSQFSQADLKHLKTENRTPYRYLTLSNIVDGIIDFSEKEVFLTEVPEKMKKYTVKNNSLVISKVSMDGTSFKSAIVTTTTQETIIADGNLIVIEFDENKVNPYFIQAFFSSSAGIATLKRAYSGTAMLTLSLEALANTLIPLPSLKKQTELGKEYEKELQNIKKLKLALKKAIENLNLIYKEE